MIKTRTSNKTDIEMTDEEFIKQKRKFKIEMKISLSNIENFQTKKKKVKEAIKIIKIMELYSNIIFNNNDNGLLKFSKVAKEKCFHFIETEPNEKELVIVCKKFLDNHYDDINFNLKCEAFTLNGSRCKNYKKEKHFCHIHEKHFKKITDILSLHLIPDISKICILKIYT
jgi:hypothetical protein